jgi:hypothetical protein
MEKQLEQSLAEIHKCDSPIWFMLGILQNWTVQRCHRWTLSAVAVLVRICQWLEQEPVLPAPALAFLWSNAVS